MPHTIETKDGGMFQSSAGILSWKDFVYRFGAVVNGKIGNEIENLKI